MRCGALDAESCAITHWCPVFGGHPEPAGWRADCPLCRAGRALQWKVAGARVKWRSFCEHHDEDVMRPALTAQLPECVPGRMVRGRQPDITLIEALASDKTITPNALRTGILQELGWTADRIRAELKMPKQTWSDAVRILGQRPRSAWSEFSDRSPNKTVRILGQRPRSQARQSQNGAA